jgi:hypothetical protein
MTATSKEQARRCLTRAECVRQAAILGRGHEHRLAALRQEPEFYGNRTSAERRAALTSRFEEDLSALIARMGELRS